MNNQDFAQILFITVFFLFLLSIVFFLFVHYIRKKIIQKEIEKSALELQFKEELISSIISAQTKERKKIARDLHDEISSNLTALLLSLHSLKQQSNIDDQNTTVIDNLININKKTLQQVRNFSHSLIASNLRDFDLNKMLQEVVNNYNNSGSIHIECNCQNEINSLNEEQQLHVFRIIIELVTNSVKHGNSSQIKVNIFREKEHVNFFYQDNGKGIPATHKLNPGIGMMNIKTRLKHLNADYEISTEKNNGFNFNFRFMEN